MKTRDKRQDWFMRINMEEPSSSAHRIRDHSRRSEPLLYLLYHYPETVTPVILRKIAESFGQKKADLVRAPQTK
jgi:hypothetical protein